ncbi:hypothetical protein FAI41_06605 [Acetobacteraceae bacterium]|nr:hypothetical protein FAI41_06605 [Acetobacteraceae bacterium]
MLKSLFFFILFCSFLGSSALADNLPPRSSGKIYLAENAGNWVYLPKTDPSGNHNIICLALTETSPYAVTLRGISGEFGLTLTNKKWHLMSGQYQNILLANNHFHFSKRFYPIDAWTLGTTLSPEEENLLFQAFSKEKEMHFALEGNEKFTLPLKGSARILSLLSNCLKESHFP